MKQKFVMKILLLSLSLSLTACLGSGDSPRPSAILTAVLSGQAPSPDLTQAEQDEIRMAWRASLPPFPVPSLQAVEAIERANDPALNQWVVDLMVLCRQLDQTCGE